MVSIGEGNKFSHPSIMVMNRLIESGVQVHRTDQLGTLWLKTDGNTIWKHPWR